MPIVILASLLIALKLPNFEAKNRHAKFDVIGVALLAGVSSTIIYGIVQASTKGDFTNHTTLAYVGAGVALMVVYGIYAHFMGDKAILPIRVVYAQELLCRNGGDGCWWCGNKWCNALVAVVLPKLAW